MSLAGHNRRRKIVVTVKNKAQAAQPPNKRFIPPDDLVDEMTFGDSIPTSVAASPKTQKVSSGFVAGLLFDVLPAAAHQAIKVSEKPFRAAVKDNILEHSVLETVKKHNDDCLEKLQPPTYIVSLLEPSIEQFLIEKDYQIPPLGSWALVCWSIWRILSFKVCK